MDINKLFFITVGLVIFLLAVNTTLNTRRTTRMVEAVARTVEVVEKIEQKTQQNHELIKHHLREHHN